MWRSPRRQLEGSMPWPWPLMLDATLSRKLTHPYHALRLSVRQSMVVVRAKRRVRGLSYRA
jgi:hypothetical protein